ncbi:hypothetical protein L284_06430 [Novosphingobium lindaniclasticum LE124]|uniref:Uncharacterized protein n=1 Tax=Novosphingobium lindaniclasticum LE124 TaxID=1096930 RepID=T0HXP8_9SPHN|nr:hypothetical protein L284_06430 [Novosphingobium lindaniclasticum LE124]
MAFALVAAVAKMVIVALVIGGLIFRTKETIGLLLLGGLFTLMSKHPAIGIPLVIGLLVIGFMAKKAEETAE